jgi:hypothetical protein
MNGDTHFTSSLWRPIQIVPMEIIEYTVMILVVLGGSLCVLSWLITATGSPLLSLLSWGAGVALSGGYAGFHPHIRTLLRLQTRILLWTWLIPVAVIPISLLLSYEETIFGTVLFLSLASWLAGGFLFGAEYVEGSKGYIQTRPVSANAVLYCKLVILLCSVIIYGNLLYLFNFIQPKGYAGIYETPFPSLIFISAGLCSAAFTVIFRDVVRGLLASGILLYLGYFLSNSISVKVHYLFHNIRFVPRGWVFQEDPFGLVVLFCLILSIPFCLLTILTTAFQIRWRHCLRFPIMAILSGTLFLMAIWTAVSCRWLDGTTSLCHATPGDPKGWEVKGNQLQWIENTPGEALSYKYLDLNDPQASPALYAVLSASTELVKERILHGNLAIVLSRIMNREDIIPRRNDGRPPTLNWPRGDIYHRIDPQCLEVYRLEGVNRPELILSQVVFEVRHRPGLHETYFQIDKRTWGQLDWCSGNITSLTGEPTSFKPSGSNFEDTIKAGIWNPTDATDGKWSAALTSPVEGSTGNQNRDSQPVMGREISLLLRHEDGTRDETTIRIPNRFFNTPYLGLKMLQRIGFPTSIVDNTKQHSSRHFFLTLGGGFLCLWHGETGRVAVWRVTDPRAPEFIGIAPTPIHEDDLAAGLVESDLPPIFRNAAPYVRSDGALGYLLPNTGIIWLEFPALMKEAKS